MTFCCRRRRCPEFFGGRVAGHATLLVVVSGRVGQIVADISGVVGSRHRENPILSVMGCKPMGEAPHFMKEARLS